MHEVERHYTHGELQRSILESLKQAGKDLEKLTVDDLAPIDEFHIRGREATKELAEQIGLDTAMHVLDVGSGLGGPSRRLALRYGCRVTGLDLTAEYCRVAEDLSTRLRLQDRVSYRPGNALNMPFAAARFDVVWTQHASMNISDKAKLYEEMHRVLKPGGFMAMYDILAGPGGDIHFPVPWAREPSISFLVGAAELQALLQQAGFEIVSWRDTTEAGRLWFETMTERVQRKGRPVLGYHILLGDDFPIMARNQVKNLREDRIILLQVVAKKSVEA